MPGPLRQSLRGDSGNQAEARTGGSWKFLRGQRGEPVQSPARPRRHVEGTPGRTRQKRTASAGGKWSPGQLRIDPSVTAQIVMSHPNAILTDMQAAIISGFLALFLVPPSRGRDRPMRSPSDAFAVCLESQR